MSLESALPIETNLFRYIISSFKIDFPEEGKQEDFNPNLIQSMVIERDYENDYFPVFRIDLCINTELYHKIIYYKKSVRFIIRLQKYIYENNKSGDKPIKKDVFNEVFIMFIDENTPFLKKDEFKKSSDLNSASATKGKTPETIGENEVSFYLFREKDIINSKKIVNTILTSSNVTDAIAYIVSSSGFNKVLMTPLDNSNTYSEMVIPPISLIHNIIYLNNQYGFHERGSTIFFDLDALYIIEKNYLCTAWRKNEYKDVIFMIRTSDKPEKISTGSYEDSKKKTYFINVFHENIQLNTSSMIKDQIEGNHRMLVNSLGGFTTNIKSSAIQRGSGTYKIMLNRYNNLYMNSAERRRIESDSKITFVYVGDVDISMFTVNKQYTFKYEDSSINKDEGGKLRMVKSVFTFMSEGDYFKIEGQLSFKK